MTDMVQVSETQSNKSVTVNENFEAVSPAAAFGIKRELTVGLTFAYYGGQLWIDGVLTTIADGTLSLTGSATNYVERTHAGVVSKNTTGFTAGLVPLYELVTSTTAITTTTDRRIPNTPFKGLVSVALSGSPSSITLTAAQARADIIELTGSLSSNWSVILPAIKSAWIIFNNTSGTGTVSVKTASGSGIDVTQGKKAILYGDGTNILRAFDDASFSISDLTVSGNSTLGDTSGDSVTVNAGTVSQPNIPCVLAYNSSTDANVTGAGATTTVDLDTEVFDQASNFATDTFTAPATGKYLFNVLVTVTDLTTAMTGFILTLDTGNRDYVHISNVTPSIAGGSHSLVLSVIADMDAADTAVVTMRVANGAGDTADILGAATLNTFLSVVRVA